MIIKAERVEDVPDALRPEPLAEDNFDLFVNTDSARDEVIPRTETLKAELKAEINPKILFAGHRGSGKSTEINRLIRDIKDEYFVVKFSVRDETDIYNINHVDLAILIAEKIFEEGYNEGHIKDKKLIKTVYEWFSEVTDIKIKEKKGEISAQAGISAKGVFGSLLGLIAEIRSQFKISSSKKQEIRQKVEPRLSQLKDSCNAMINEVEQNLNKEGKKLLVVVEDLDKVDLPMIQDIFFKHSGILGEINTRIIFTVHIFLFNSPYKRLLPEKFREVALPMIKVHEKDGSPCAKGIEKIRDIISKRMNLDIFSGQGLDNAIAKTGGVLRDLFRAIERAATAAPYHKEDKIQGNRIAYGLNIVKNEYNDMIVGIKEGDFQVTTESLYKKLDEIKSSKSKVFKRDDALQVLLNCQAVIEYNGNQWFDVHPLVIDLLKDMGKE